MLNFVGVGSAFNTRLGNTSAWMKRDDRLLLIDCGGSVFERLIGQDLLKGISALDLCITHTHGDHVGSLGDLVLYCHFILKIKPVLRHPDPVGIRTLLNIFGVPEGTYVLDASMNFELTDWMEGSFVLLEHADTMHAYGVLIKMSQMSVWYSGDSKEIPEEIMTRFLRGEIDIFYQDTSGADYPGALHMSLSRLESIVPKALRGRVVCMHQDEAFDGKRAEELGFRVAIPGSGQ